MLAVTRTVGVRVTMLITVVTLAPAFAPFSANTASPYCQHGDDTIHVISCNHDQSWMALKKASNLFSNKISGTAPCANTAFAYCQHRETWMALGGWGAGTASATMVMVKRYIACNHGWPQKKAWGVGGGGAAFPFANKISGTAPPLVQIRLPLLPTW